MHGFHTAPLGRESLSRTFTQDFILGYFRPLPTGGMLLLAQLLPPFRTAGPIHPELLQISRPPATVWPPPKILLAKSRGFG